MSPAIYSWSEDYFCANCIIYAMSEHPPYSQWAEEHDISKFNPIAALLSMTTYLIRNHISFTLPVEEKHPTGVIFCAVCLSLLHDEEAS